jgi:AraC family transcriptional regulator
MDAPRSSAHYSAYVARINRVVNYIDAHLTEPLDLNTLAEVAHFSSWHFHRIFQGMTGETLADCVRRHRLETAANRLLHTRAPVHSLLQIALGVGFASAEVFSRTFKAHFGCTPSAWRRGGWKLWAEQHQDQMRKIHQVQSKQYQDFKLVFTQDIDIWPVRQIPFISGTTMHIEVKQLPAARVAYLRHTGPFGLEVSRTWDRFATWCSAQGLNNPRRTMWGISQDNPNVTAPEHCRYDCCVEVDDKFQPQGEIGVQLITAGQFACLQFHGTPLEIGAAWMQLYGQWLPSSGYQPAETVAPYELYTEDFAVDPVTGAFSCWLCAPVRPL